MIEEYVRHHQPPYSTSTLVQLLRWRALHQPENVAYNFLLDGEAQERPITYAQLDQKARTVAAALQAMNLAGERVLLLYPPGLQFIVSFFGCLYAGAIAVPAYPPRSNQHLSRLESIAKDAAAKAALTVSSIVRRVQSSLSRTPCFERLLWIDTDRVAADQAESWNETSIDAEVAAFIQYTSGSTTSPKGVVLTHANLWHNEKMIQSAFPQPPGAIIVSWLPLYHDMGLIGTTLHALFIGAKCVLMSPESFLQRPFRWLQAISRFQATTSGAPNFAYDLCCRRISAEQAATLDLRSWRIALNGAEPIHVDSMERFAATFAAAGFQFEAFHP